MKRDDELFIRWMEMDAFSLMMRSHESIRPWANSQFDAPGVKRYTVELTNIHASLKPYIAHCAALAGEGVAAMRPDFWEAADYRKSRDPYAYFLGEDLFVCPIVERKRRLRRAFLPAGEWVHFWTGRVYAGDASYLVPAPLGRLPVFYRKGSTYESLFRRTAAQYNLEG